MFDNLKFWKKKEDDFGLNLDPMLDANSSTSATNLQTSNPFSSPQSNPFGSDLSSTSAFSPTSFSEKSHLDSNAGGNHRDFELVSSKLDTIKAMLETISARLDRLEREREPIVHRYESRQNQNTADKRWF